MQPQTIERAADRPAGPSGPGLEARFPGKYVSSTSFRHDGTGVATPVWFVVENDQLPIQTDPRSFKAKRIRRNPAVMIAPYTASGRLRGDPVPAKAEFLPEGEMDHVGQLLARNYRLDRILILPIYRAGQRPRGAPAESTNVAVVVTRTSTTSGQMNSEDSP